MIGQKWTITKDDISDWTWEAKTIFNDPYSITIPDPEHSDEEERWLDIGISADGRLLVVWYTERGEKIRIIGFSR